VSSEYDYEAAVIGMLTLRIKTPVGEWLSDEDLEPFFAYQLDAASVDGADDANESLLLAMMNTAWLAVQHLAALTGEPREQWLQRIALDLRRAP
jgi:hypothetical protein